MARSRAPLLAVVLALVLPGLVLPGTAGADVTPLAGAGAPDQATIPHSRGAVEGDAAAATPTPTPTRPPADTTIVRVRVLPNGSARWTLEIRTRLDSPADVEGFERFRARFRNDSGRFLGRFTERMRGVVADAREATGREMRAVDFTADTAVQEVPRRWGVVRYSFLWTNFARADGRALVVGDVFRGGFFLAENDTLAVVATDGYEIADAAPSPAVTDTGRVAWQGQFDFGDGRPRLRLVPAEGDPSDDGDGGQGGLPILPLVGGGLAVAVLGGAVWYVRRGAGAVPPGRGDAGVPPDAATGMLTDAERVEALLGERGRMRQADVAEELGWSASKTSRTLSSMVEEGRVEKLQLGRENLVQLPGEE